MVSRRRGSRGAETRRDAEQTRGTSRIAPRTSQASPRPSHGAPGTSHRARRTWHLARGTWSLRTCVLLALFCTIRLAAAAPVIDRVMAVVQGEIITLSDVNAAIGLGLVNVRGATDPAAAALEPLIERRLQLIEVERYAPPEPNPRAIDARLEALRARLGPDLQRRLAAYGLTELQLRQIARDDLRLAIYLEQRFASVADPTDEEVQRYYRERQQEFIRDGAQQPLSEVDGEIRQRIEAARRVSLIGEWSRGLRLRADVLVIPAASASESR